MDESKGGDFTNYFLAFPVEGEKLTAEEKSKTKLGREGVLELCHNVSLSLVPLEKRRRDHLIDHVALLVWLYDIFSGEQNRMLRSGDTTMETKTNTKVSDTSPVRISSFAQIYILTLQILN